MLEAKLPLKTRRIPKNPTVSALSPGLIKLLTDLCFRKDDPIEPCDLIFVFSTVVCEVQLANLITEYLNQGIANKVFLTGGMAPYHDVSHPTVSECDLVLQHIPADKFPEVKFYTERASTNTRDNILEALKVYNFTKLQKIMFIFKSHATGRGYLTLRKSLPKAKLIQKTFSVR